MDSGGEPQSTAFSLRTFGGLELLDERGQAIPFSEKALVILAYLISTGRRTATRTEVAELLWGRGAPSTAFTNLRRLVLRIRSRQSELDAHFLAFSSREVELKPSLLKCDVSLFATAEPQGSFDELKTLVDRLRSVFLGETDLRNPLFGHWVAQQRERQSAALEHALRTMASLAKTAEQRAVVQQAALHVFLTDSNDQIARKFLLQAYDVQGEVDHLRRTFERRNEMLSSWMKEKRQSVKIAARPATVEAINPAGLDEPPTPCLPRLALLPPSNYSREPAAAMIVTSLLEDITIGFCVLNSVQVLAPYSALQISRKTEGQLAMLEHHGLTYVLETRLSGVDEELSLFLQLVFLPTSEIVWAERLSLDGARFAQNRRDISGRLALSVASEIERHRITRSNFDRNPAAYHRYLLGRQFFDRLTLPNLHRARKEMKAVLQESANFAPALSSLARTYSEEWILTARGEADLLKSAETYALQAIETRSDMADGYRELGVAKLLQGALDESVETLQLAETLSPHYADIIADHADALAHCSRLDTACQTIERAIELNPISPDSYLWTAAGACYGLGRFEATLGYIDRMADGSLADRLAAASWAMLGHRDKAQTFVARTRQTHPEFDVDNWLSIVPIKENWHKDIYREGLKKAGF
ncbi:hypothetical protein [Ensifer sp. LC163]|uniref:hypothetical protein n=1 Tax=Ensifer sp. LC163 TaxID=1120652 RepID=UPI0008137D5E|nr:hypothetical protein [Ensifer sp. LC163]OCP35519.1 hypothetical protein BC360_09610 [Ensifer sp. LC163]